MSGHSKWANIKNRKGAQDKKRSEAFTKAAKNILTAIRAQGGNSNPASNTALAEAIAKAREINMPKENIDRLIHRFENSKENLTRCQFEGFGPFGVPIIVEAETDNKNRTLSVVRSIFKEYGGNLGDEGSVMYLFDRVGEVELAQLTEEVELKLIDEGAIDFEGNSVIVEVNNLNNMVDKVNSIGLTIENFGLTMRAKTPIVLKNEDEVAKVLEMIAKLEENDEVINVFSGFDYHVEEI